MEQGVGQSMEAKRKRISTLASTEQMKKQKISITYGVAMERNQHTPQVNPVQKTPETRVSSTSNRRFNFDRVDYVEVARLIKSNALEIANHVEFLVEEVGKRDKEVQRLIQDKDEIRSEGTRMTAELEMEKTTRLNVEGELSKSCKEIDSLIKEKDKLWSDASQLKVEFENEKTERLKVGDQLAKSLKDFEHNEWDLLNQWKKSVTGSFQNALHQVRLGLPGLDLSSITLDPLRLSRESNWWNAHHNNDEATKDKDNFDP